MTLGALDLVTASAHRNQTRALDYVHLTPAQEEWQRFDGPEALWIDGNAVGKSFGLAWMVVQFLRGTHPHLRRRPPVTAMVLGFSWDQMLPLMEKLWLLTPKDEVAEHCGFMEGRGLIGKPPRLVLDKGPGAGSRAVFSTYKAGSRRIAGGQYDLCVLDEPPEERIVGEIRPRLLRRRGFLRIGMTPTPDMPPIEYLLEKVDQGKLPRHNVGLSEAACWPRGFPAPWHWQREIDEYAGGLLEHERAMRIYGDATRVASGRWIPSFVESDHMVDVDLDELVGWYLVVGLDHGTAGGKQCAVLIAVHGRTTDRPQVVYLDEVKARGATTPEEDVEAVLAMLARNGLMYDSVDAWVGDIPAWTRTKRTQVVKSNREFRAELARKLGRTVQQTRKIDEPHKGDQSVSLGCRLVNTLFRRGMARVKRRCKHLRGAFMEFDGDPHHPTKDVLDAGRYATEAAVTSPALRGLLQARY